MGVVEGEILIFWTAAKMVKSKQYLAAKVWLTSLCSSYGTTNIEQTTLGFNVTIPSYYVQGENDTHNKEQSLKKVMHVVAILHTLRSLHVQFLYWGRYSRLPPSTCTQQDSSYAPLDSGSMLERGHMWLEGSAVEVYNTVCIQLLMGGFERTRVQYIYSVESENNTPRNASVTAWMSSINRWYSCPFWLTFGISLNFVANWPGPLMAEGAQTVIKSTLVENQPTSIAWRSDEAVRHRLNALCFHLQFHIDTSNLFSCMSSNGIQKRTLSIEICRLNQRTSIRSDHAFLAANEVTWLTAEQPITQGNWRMWAGSLWD